MEPAWVNTHEFGLLIPYTKDRELSWKVSELTGQIKRLSPFHTLGIITLHFIATMIMPHSLPFPCVIILPLNASTSLLTPRSLPFLLYFCLALKTLYFIICIHAQSCQSCLTLCNPRDCSSPGSSVHGILQARILEWVAMPSSRDQPDPGIKPVSPVSPIL